MSRLPFRNALVLDTVVGRYTEDASVLVIMLAGASTNHGAVSRY